MDRDLLHELVKWKDSPGRKPLLLRGARQVGKSWLVEEFGRKHFARTLTVNLELHADYRASFASLNPPDIIRSLELLTGQTIDKDTLLFLDEIQECPDAIRSLRYFHERLPDQPVVGAGSLLEFALNAADFRMPVGRLSFLYLYPLSFQEFLRASNNEKLADFLTELPDSAPELTRTGQDLIPTAIHQRLLELLRRYILVGGMPGIAAGYLAEDDHIAGVKRAQSELLQTFRHDFGKYASRAMHKHLTTVFDVAPRLIGNRIKYATVDPDSRSREIKEAIGLLASAEVIRPVVKTSASGIPLEAQSNPRRFKLLFLDVGLAASGAGIEQEFVLQDDLMLINAGALAEQFVGQELLLSQPGWQPGRLHYWDREARSSSAEVDYVITVDTDIIPVEVKSGKTGRLRSLRRFIEERSPVVAVRLYSGPPRYDGAILSLPLYAAGHIHSWVRQVQNAL